MLIYVLDEQFKKIDLLRKYTFAQYTDMFRNIGTFTINARIVKENLFLLDKTKQYYILFDNKIVGEVKNVTRDSDSEYEKVITITGKLAPTLFENRVINGTLNFSGYTFDYVKELVETQITDDVESKRYIPINVEVLQSEDLKEHCSTIDKQVTGGYIWDEMLVALEQDSLGIRIYPEGDKLVASAEKGIEEWKLQIQDGVDRTKGNTDGNIPVIFSQSLSNISRTSYVIDRTNYKNVAYVAGEGEETDRKWYEIYSNESEESKIGWQRKELWVDARDVQSENADGTTMSEEQYEEAIKQRANEKFTETKLAETYTATITNANKQYTYGVDYNIGDYVTIIDDELGITVDVQITEVTKSIEGNQEIVDIGFTYGVVRRDPVEDIKNNTSKIEQIRNDIKYIENTALRSDFVADMVRDGVYNTCRKWNSGLVEMDLYIERDTSSSDYSSYPTGLYSANFSSELPDKFKGIIKQVFTVASGVFYISNNAGWISRFNLKPDTNMIFYSIVRNGNSGTIQVSFHITGRWK